MSGLECQARVAVAPTVAARSFSEPSLARRGETRRGGICFDLTLRKKCEGVPVCGFGRGEVRDRGEVRGLLRVVTWGGWGVGKHGHAALLLLCSHLSRKEHSKPSLPTQHTRTGTFLGCRAGRGEVTSPKAERSVSKIRERASTTPAPSSSWTPHHMPTPTHALAHTAPIHLVYRKRRLWNPAAALCLVPPSTRLCLWHKPRRPSSSSWVIIIRFPLVAWPLLLLNPVATRGNDPSDHEFRPSTQHFDHR